MRLSILGTSFTLIACLIGAFLVVILDQPFSIDQAKSALQSLSLVRIGKTIDPTTLAIALAGAAVAIGLCFASVRRSRQ